MKHFFSLCFLLLGVTALFAQDSDDLKISADFNVYLSRILSSESDNVAIIDSSLNYRFVYKTSLPLQFQRDLNYKHFADSAFLICTANPEAHSSSNFQLDFLLTDTLFVEQANWHATERKILNYSTFENLLPQTDIHFGDPIIFTSEYTHVFSFDNGRYLILCERRFGPDIRGSMPPGTAVSLFLERVE